MIEIHKSPAADTRTCDFSNIDKRTLLNSSAQHITDVRPALAFFGAMLTEVQDDDK